MFGVMRRIRPEDLSVASHQRPSGPSLTSRMRSRSPCNRRSSFSHLVSVDFERNQTWPTTRR